MTIQLKSHAWPGGYPIAALMDDGELLCVKCTRDPSNPTHRNGDNDGWKIIGPVILYEEGEFCAHCGEEIA